MQYTFGPVSESASGRARSAGKKDFFHKLNEWITFHNPINKKIIIFNVSTFDIKPSTSARVEYKYYHAHEDHTNEEFLLKLEWAMKSSSTRKWSGACFLTFSLSPFSIPFVVQVFAIYWNEIIEHVRQLSRGRRKSTSASRVPTPVDPFWSL